MTRARDAELSALSNDVRDLLQRRAERIRVPEVVPEAEEEAIWVASFALGSCEYAIPLSALRAAVPLGAITPVPCSSPVVLGVLQFQGEIIAALSTSALLGGGWDVEPTILLVVDAGASHTVALDCAEVPMATTLPLLSFRQAAAVADGALVRVTIPGRGAATVIDLPRLLEQQDYRGQDGRA